MEKIMRITERQLNDFNNPNKRILIMRSVLGIKTEGVVVNVGDTMVRVNHANRLDVYKDVFAMKEVYYIIVKVIDENLAYAYSIY